jgi:hypothetical protein
MNVSPKPQQYALAKVFYIYDAVGRCLFVDIIVGENPTTEKEKFTF